MTEGLRIERSDSILRLTFDRPDRLNALSAEMVAATTEAIEHSQERVIVLRGSGRAFCTGADVEGIQPSTVGAAVDAASALIRAIVSSPRPIVAAVNGPAAGVGCSIALACDFTVAHESAYFLLAFAKIGLMPDGGSTAFVAASIGRARAIKMALLAEPLGAADAAAMGLIDRAVEDGSYDDEVERLISQLASGPTLSYAQSKAAINAATLGDLEEAFARERAGQIALLQSVDALEGLSAFGQKRKPDFAGT